MLRASLVSLGSLLLLAPAAPSAAKSGDHALYLSQRYALAGDIAEALKAAREIGAARPACTVVVKLRARGATIPLCAPTALRRPAAVTARIEALLRNAAGRDARTAARLLDE